MLAQLVAAAGGRVEVAKRLPDDTGAVAHAIRQALETCDIVLTIGGVSAGDHDPVKGAATSLPDVELWRVAMRPGRPQAFGTPSGRLFFGLPGNPASVACVFEALVRPAFRALLGYTQLDRPRVPVHVAAAIESRAGRTDFVRATLEWRDSELWATPAGAQLSGHLLPQSLAHALARRARSGGATLGERARRGIGAEDAGAVAKRLGAFAASGRPVVPGARPCYCVPPHDQLRGCEQAVRQAGAVRGGVVPAESGREGGPGGPERRLQDHRVPHDHR
jgi:molybdenum cofactor synthesis domain-containing protein